MNDHICRNIVVYVDKYGNEVNVENTKEDIKKKAEDEADNEEENEGENEKENIDKEEEMEVLSGRPRRSPRAGCSPGAMRRSSPHVSPGPLSPRSASPPQLSPHLPGPDKTSPAAHNNIHTRRVCIIIYPSCLHHRHFYLLSQLCMKETNLSAMEPSFRNNAIKVRFWELY